MGLTYAQRVFLTVYIFAIGNQKNADKLHAGNLKGAVETACEVTGCDDPKNNEDYYRLACMFYLKYPAHRDMNKEMSKIDMIIYDMSPYPYTSKNVEDIVDATE